MKGEKAGQFVLYVDGQCEPGFKTADVKQSFANLFGITDSALESIFCGKAVFLKNNLNRLSLGQYRDALAEIGLKVFYWEQPTERSEEDDSHEAAPALKSCPKCGHTRENNQECHHCGIVFAKYHLSQKRSSEKKASAIEDEEEHFEDSIINPDEQHARRGIQLGSTLMVSVFLIDTIMQNKGVDIGFWPYIIANLFFFYGGWYFAKARGYGVPVRCIGVFNLMGVAVLYLLPNRATHTRSKGSVLKSTAAAVLAILIGLYWISEYYHQQQALHQFLAYSETVQWENSLFPHGQTETDPEFFSEKQEMMKRFVEKGITTLKETSFRPNGIQQITNRIFSTLADYFIWLQYQQYLNALAYEELPEHLTRESISALKIEFKHLIRAMTEDQAELEKNPVFIRVYYTWTSGCLDWDIVTGNCVDIDAGNNQILNRYLFKIYDYFREREFSLTAYSNPNRRYSQQPLPGYPKNVISSIKKIDDNIVEIRLGPDNPDEMAEKRLVVAFYKRPYRRFGKLLYYPVLTCIGGNLPNKFLHSDNNVFHDWQKDDIFGL